jgi:hypothetical protein
MRQQRQLSRVQDEEETMVMKVMDKSGAAKERRIVWYTRTDPQDLNKILMRFLSPRDLENTGLLTWEKRDGDDDQWLYLPATKKVKRIAASGKKSRFMGTDFAFEDLRSENLALYTYTLTGTETVDGQACYIIEAVPATARQAADSGYSKRRLWVRQDHYQTVKQEFYDKKGQLEKVEHKRQLVNVKGMIWRANETEMHDVQAGTRTLVQVLKRVVDQGLNDNFFTETELTRGGS